MVRKTLLHDPLDLRPGPGWLADHQRSNGFHVDLGWQLPSHKLMGRHRVDSNIYNVWLAGDLGRCGALLQLNVDGGLRGDRLHQDGGIVT